MTSRPFSWLGGGQSPGGEPVTSVTIEFFGSAPVRLQEGDSKELVLPFRHPVQRVIRLVDQHGRAIPGVKVVAQIFFFSSNHCGATEGETLVRGDTNRAGEVVVPDANAEYALEFYREHHVLQQPTEAGFPKRLIRELPAPVTTVALRKLEKSPLLLEVNSGGLPAVGLQLEACVAHCPCGACCGKLGETDQLGRVLIEDFYPEEIDRMAITDRSGKVLWEGNSGDLQPSGWTSITVVNGPKD